MSDDRTDRAERIHNMRDGNRGTDDTNDAATDDGDASTDRSAGGEPADHDTSAGGSGSRESEDRDTATDDAGFSPLTTGDDAASASDAQTAAQRAAESAAQVTGTAESGAGGGGATDASTVPGDLSGVEIPDRQLLEEAVTSSSAASTEGGARAAMEGDTTRSGEVVRVLEFSLGEEYYCLDIEYVEEIVKRETVTRVPNTPDFVDGVVDLRGQITTILEPKEMIDIDSEGDQNLIIVFDPGQFEDQGAIGWVVDEVRQVVPVPESDINTPPVDARYINGVVDRDEYDQFVIWIEPEDALAQATATE